MKSDKERRQTRIAVYLIGMREQTVLLGKRKNTGHMDGHWSLIAGHAYEGESSSQAIIREAEEECGLILTSNNLKLIGAMHHCSPPFDYINFVFFADLSSHEPKNLEPHKCEALEFHHIEDLPNPMERYIVEIIKESVSKKPFWVSEFGWKNE